ncbi:MAG TPA: glycogen synthase GlgA [Methylomirabilota bacterium]|nr:glycogen synthase GlgA [Methylomirabilota bacterium]
MAQRLRVLLVASEVSPFGKTGGLGDVAAALPRALRALGHDVRILMPRYRDVERHGSGIRTVVPRLEVPVGDRRVESALLGTETSAGVPVYFLQQDQYFDRDGLYGTGDGDYSDNCERFVFFCRGALEALIALDGEGRDGWRPQIIHANDWQTGLISVYLRTLYRDHPALRAAATVFTIHNLAYQGVFWHHDMPMTGLGWDVFTPAGLEFYGKLNFLKGGLVFSDLLTTVSRTYAAEIRTAEFGNGLEGVLEERAQDLHGVVNGIDYEQWNPAKDPALPRPYSAGEPEGKVVCREALRRELGLRDVGLNDAPGPLVAMVTRLAGQKGLDLALESLPGMLDAGCRVALLGSGDSALEEAWIQAAARHPGTVAVRIGYDPELASRMYAGADCFLMPSRYEPCGLAQLIALRYGAVPVVRRTGGLADTVTEFDPARRTGTGFLFDAFSADALLEAVRRAAAAFRRPELWGALVKNAMTEDFSWDTSAREYAQLYKKVLRPQGARPSRRSR